MSGIEAVGLILGAVPLIISALEHYKKTRETWLNFRHKSLYIDQLIEALAEQKVLIETDIRLILRAVYLDEVDDDLIKAHSCLQLLHRPEVVADVAQYLGDIYEPYRRALNRCQNSVVEISKNLGGLVIGPNVSRHIHGLSRFVSLMISKVPQIRPKSIRSPFSSKYF